MSKMTVSELLTIRAAFARMKHTLARAGYDVSGVRYITDIPAVLCSVVPEGEENMMDELTAMLGTELVSKLYDTLGTAAKRGAMTRVFEACVPSDKVEEGDLDA